MILYLDTETFSPVDLKRCGVHRYAEEAEVLLTAWAEDDAEAEVEDGWPAHIADRIAAAEWVVIHNSHFDRTVLRHAEGVDLPISKIWDTMAQARSVGLPGGLGKIGDVLGLSADEAKDKEGRAWINLFCKLRKGKERATKHTHPEEWRRFREYARRDIGPMRHAFKRLPRANYANPTERALWEVDQAINDRGVTVDLDLARAAVAAVTEEQARLAARCVELTDGEVQRATQRAKLLAHLLEAYGVSLPDLTASTLERRLQDEELPWPVRELIAIRLQASATSTSKYQRLIDAASSDGRLRGTLEWCGAARTGRWAGRLFQPQNLPRSPAWFNEREQAATVSALKAGCADLVFDDMLDRASYALRGSIVASPGHSLAVSDLSNIEGRVLAWLAGEEWKLDAFRAYDDGRGPDLYYVTAGSVLGKPPEAVTKDERQSAGKVPELACGYQGAVGAFASMAALYGLDLPENEVLRIVKQWRRSNPEIVSFWYQLQDAALSATRTPGVEITCRKLRLRRDGAWLAIRLPSGRALLYAQPRIIPARRCTWCHGTGKEPIYAEDDLDFERQPIGFSDDDKCYDCRGRGKHPEILTYRGLDPYTRRWRAIHTYGGKLVENVTQAVARDVMGAALLKLERGNYPARALLTVHDEIIAEVPDGAEFDHDDLSGLLSIPPPWAEGLPLAAGGFTTKRYRKE